MRVAATASPPQAQLARPEAQFAHAEPQLTRPQAQFARRSRNLSTTRTFAANREFQCHLIDDNLLEAARQAMAANIRSIASYEDKAVTLVSDANVI